MPPDGPLLFLRYLATGKIQKGVRGEGDRLPSPSGGVARSLCLASARFLHVLESDPAELDLPVDVFADTEVDGLYEFSNTLSNELVERGEVFL